MARIPDPHDGLLEMHDVDKSLQTKIKTLIFIPILSQTYCDPKSFAWEHEFKAFNRMASKDDFGILGRICQQENIPDKSIFHGNEKVVDIFLKIQKSLFNRNK